MFTMIVALASSSRSKQSMVACTVSLEQPKSSALMMMRSNGHHRGLRWLFERCRTLAERTPRDRSSAEGLLSPRRFRGNQRRSLPAGGGQDLAIRG